MDCAKDWQYIVASIDSQHVYLVSYQEDFTASGWVYR